MRSWTTRGFFYIGGLIILTLGVSMTIKSNLGAGGWDALAVGLAERSGFTIGTWVYIIGAVIVSVNAVLIQKKPNLKAFLTIFFIGTFIDIWLLYVLSSFAPPEHIAIQLMVLLPGIFLLALGIALYTRGRIANHPIDDLMLILSHKLQISLRASRVSCEIGAVVLALLFSGPVSIGTFAITFFLGPFIQLLFKPVEAAYVKLVAE